MYVTITANPALNRIALIQHRSGDRGVDVRPLKNVAGGSGVSAGRVLKTLGAEVILTGFVGGEIGDQVEALLDLEHLAHRFVRVEHCTRLTNIYLEPAEPYEVEYKEPGPQLRNDEIEALVRTLGELADTARAVHIGGSPPLHAPADLLRRLVSAATGAGASITIDAEGEQLLSCLDLCPTLVKCNRREAETALGVPVSNLQVAACAAARLLDRGAQASMISLGADGAILAVQDPDITLAARPPTIQNVDTTGCGDALVSACMFRLMEGESHATALSFATAVAAANALMPGAGVFNYDMVPDLLHQVRVSEVKR